MVFGACGSGSAGQTAAGPDSSSSTLGSEISLTATSETSPSTARSGDASEQVDLLTSIDLLSCEIETEDERRRGAASVMFTNPYDDFYTSIEFYVSFFDADRSLLIDEVEVWYQGIASLGEVRGVHRVEVPQSTERIRCEIAEARRLFEDDWLVVD
jgi:hypothetical protein